MNIETVIVLNGVAWALNYYAYKTTGFMMNKICAFISGGLFIGGVLGYIAYGVQ